jgi:hypothetical protein
MVAGCPQFVPADQIIQYTQPVEDACDTFKR